MRRSSLFTLSTQGWLHDLSSVQLPDAQHTGTQPSETGFPVGGPSCPGLLPPVLEVSPQRNAGATDGHPQGGRVNTGWEVCPLARVLLVLLIGVMLYYIVTKLTHPSKDDHPRH